MRRKPHPDERKHRSRSPRALEAPSRAIRCGITILAGGLSTRMGRDKARLKLAGRTLLGHIRSAAEETGLSVRVIRRDLVTRCGPLGGVYTALKTSSNDAELFLACDMPLVSRRLLERLLAQFERHAKGVFAFQDGRLGFPFVLPCASLVVVEDLLARGEFSLGALANVLRAQRFEPKGALRQQLFNVNNAADWEQARQRFRTP